MSPRRAVGTESAGGRVGFTALLLVVAAVGMLLLLRARPNPEPFDPRSGDGSGTRGLVVLLQHEGATVSVVRAAPAVGEPQRVLVLEDRLDDTQRRELLAFAEGGGVVVVADPASTLAGDLGAPSEVADKLPSFGANDVASQINVPLDDCDVPALAHLRGVFVRAGVRFHASPAATSTCFENQSGAFAVVAPRGAGLIVQLGDNELFTNSLLRYADNGPLATALLAPTDGSRVDILLGQQAAKTAADIGTGQRTLSDLVRPGVWMALTQLAIAFVIFAIARAIRPGRPVREPEQVPIAGSELVVATGNLMQRARHADRAGWLLRGNLYRSLCNEFRLPATTTINDLDAAVAAQTSLSLGQVASVLLRDVHDNAELVQLSNSLQAIRDATPLGRLEVEGVSS
ncbi:MAG TPA: DUF4350 domain-containing protein [Ilumatobacteraceae bacterium]|nr:DUF4350 domain-containing protein [Ilumatobacteraceae bacterium]HRB03711.1 DUF4350 domain-containing protein [Ilumatobacteraceae bacterium]